MRRDHRPYYAKRIYRRLEGWYARRRLRPQFDTLGKGAAFFKPWHVEVFGPRISLGDYATVIAAPDLKVRLCVWPAEADSGEIRIGRYALICPGVRIGSAVGVSIADNCMIASGAYITDSDWHGLYDRVSSGIAAPVAIAENVWIGDRALICKGVSIGRNSVVGAAAVVTRDVPENAVVAGNPAAIVKRLDPDRPMVPRDRWFADPVGLARELDRWDRDILRGNTTAHWLRNLLFPMRGD